MKLHLMGYLTYRSVLVMSLLISLLGARLPRFHEHLLCGAPNSSSKFLMEARFQENHLDRMIYDAW